MFRQAVGPKNVSRLQKAKLRCLRTAFKLSALLLVCSFGAVTLLNNPRKAPLFVTFAFTSDAGGRWSAESCETALRVQYSSLVKSQKIFPHLYVYTDDPGVVPNFTFSGLKTKISTIVTTPWELPQNAYSGVDSWRSLSRSKLDVVENLIRDTKSRVIWIDLDTLLFTDLSVSNSHSWVIGYQHGSCVHGNCSAEHTRSGGPFDREIEPRFDAYGDLWSLDRDAIRALRKYEKQHLSRDLPLPVYDLQGYFTLMLQDDVLPASLLHDLIHFNFGFVCSQFQHPASHNMDLRVENGTLMCPVYDLAGTLSERVGSISFTAPTFQNLFINRHALDFSWVADDKARSWLMAWFHA